jgi:hypothetical protein
MSSPMTNPTPAPSNCMKWKIVSISLRVCRLAKKANPISGPCVNYVSDRRRFTPASHQGTVVTGSSALLRGGAVTFRRYLLLPKR